MSNFLRDIRCQYKRRHVFNVVFKEIPFWSSLFFYQSKMVINITVYSLRNAQVLQAVYHQQTGLLLRKGEP